MDPSNQQPTKKQKTISYRKEVSYESPLVESGLAGDGFAGHSFGDGGIYHDGGVQ